MRFLEHSIYIMLFSDIIKLANQFISAFLHFRKSDNIDVVQVHTAHSIIT